MIYVDTSEIDKFKRKMIEISREEVYLNTDISDFNTKNTLSKIITIINILIYTLGVAIPLSMLSTDGRLIYNIPIKIWLLVAVSVIYLGFSSYLLFVVQSINPLNNTSAQKYSEDENIRKLIWEEK